MNLIVAVDKNWSIGYQGQLLARIPEDMKNFKRLTVGNIIIVGRKTLESFPDGKPLPERINIVLTRNKEYTCKDAVVCHTISQLNEIIRQYPDKEVYVAGGAQIYKQLLPYCQSAYITKLDKSFPADTAIENLDRDKHWKMTECSEKKDYKGVGFQFTKYERIINHVP